MEQCTPFSLYGALPLNARYSEIRLLILHAAGWDEPIRCDFEVVSLNNGPTYSALSYVWGREDANHKISLSGYQFWVRPNLWAALRRLRAHGGDKRVTVWVDALCINQSSVAERNSQVAMMGEIYSQSERVQVWLGELEFAPGIWPDSTAATDPGRCYDIPTVYETLELPPLNEQRSEFSRVLDSLPQSEVLLRVALFLQLMAKRSDFVREVYLFWNPTSSDRMERHWKDVLLAILKNPWFDRLWVVQEVVLAPTVNVLIGPIALPLSTFTQAKSAHLQHKQWPYYGGFNHDASEFLLETAISPFVDIARMRRQIRDCEVDLTLAELRLQLARRAATVDHDQVFSLIGVSKYLRDHLRDQMLHTENEPQLPDYNSPPAALYKHITQQHIKQKINLLPLSISSHKESNPETQSWTIDWTILQGTSLNFDQLLWSRGYTLFNADHGLTAAPPTFEWQEDLGMDVLRLEGHQVDRVASCTPFVLLFNNNNTVLRALRQHDPELSYPGAEGVTWSNAWIRCLTADSITTNDSYYEGRTMSQPHRLGDDPDDEGFKSRGRYVLAAHDPWIQDASKSTCKQGGETRSIWGRYRYTGHVPPHSPEVNRLREFKEALDAQVEGVTKGRILFLTEQGYLGVTNKCNVGDEIYIVGGGKMPIILERNVKAPVEEGVYYRVASDCYLHGFMDGQHNASLNEAAGLLRSLNIL